MGTAFDEHGPPPTRAHDASREKKLGMIARRTGYVPLR